MPMISNMTRRLRLKVAAFSRNQMGFGTLEFAMIVPLMMVMVFGISEACSAFQAVKKMNLSGNALADLVAQERDLTPDKLDDIFTGMNKVVTDTVGDATATFKVISVKKDDDDITVEWSRSSAGGEPYAPGSPYAYIDEDNFFDDSVSVIVTEIVYNYTSPTARSLGPEYSYTNRYYRWPRRVKRISFGSGGTSTSQQGGGD